MLYWNNEKKICAALGSIVFSWFNNGRCLVNKTDLKSYFFRNSRENTTDNSAIGMGLILNYFKIYLNIKIYYILMFWNILYESS